MQDETHFCPNCGAAVNAAPGFGQTLQAAPPPVRKSPIPKVVSAVIAAVVGVTAFMLVRYVVIPEVFSGDSGTSSVVSETEDSAVSKEESSASSEDKTQNSNREEYNRVFWNRHIVHSSALFPNLDDAAFAIVDKQTGLVHCMEFGYAGDIVMAMTETAYFPLEGYTEEERARLIKGMRESYAEYDGYDFCTINSWETDSYYAVQLEYTGMNQPENRKKMIEWGMLEENAAYISLDKTEKTLLSQGYVKE